MQSSYTDIILVVSSFTLTSSPFLHANNSYQNKWEHISEREVDFVFDHLNTLNELTPKIRCKGRNGVDPSLIFGLESKLFLGEKPKEDGVATTHNDEVETVTVYRGSPEGRKCLHHDHHHNHGAEETCHWDQVDDSDVEEDGFVTPEALTVALNLLSKETIWRVKGFVTLPSGVHILNWAFGRHDLIPMNEVGKEKEVVKLTVMGERGEVKRAIRKFCASIDANIL